MMAPGPGGLPLFAQASFRKGRLRVEQGPDGVADSATWRPLADLQP